MKNFHLNNSHTQCREEDHSLGLQLNQGDLTEGNFEIHVFPIYTTIAIRVYGFLMKYNLYGDRKYNLTLCVL